MIEQPTVFVLGAGASCCYGFPCGIELMSRVHELLLREETNGFLSRYHGVEVPLTLKDDLHKVSSIDDLIARRPEYERIGKLLIAGVISEHEKEAAFNFKHKEGRSTYNNTWYNILWKQMYDGVLRLENLVESNAVSFITFNYDRSVEQFLFLAAKALYKGSDEATGSEIAQIPIIHVYGRLGALPWQNSSQALTIPYTHLTLTESQHAQQFKTCIANLRTYSEFHSGISQEIHGYLREAKNLYFLGFGYHPQNIKLLETDMATVSGRERRMHIAGTAWKMGLAQKAAATQRLKKVLSDQVSSEDFHDKTCEEFLVDVASIW